LRARTHDPSIRVAIRKLRAPNRRQSVAVPDDLATRQLPGIGFDHIPPASLVIFGGSHD
jgi:hypothetical protein